ncbi:hypothetical protein ACIP5Y_14965 [Nocardia sp. NPDC088792]|uniref:hypothetical protein n=1 Tax=Nocardia sp. NPDC088792 TaxID=3364332 RepID=UPI0038099E49
MTTNPALADLQILIGDWDMELSRTSFLPTPDAVAHGKLAVEWVDPGAAVVMRMGDASTPTATWIIGRDEAHPEYTVLYTDDRGFSRVYDMTFAERHWQISRTTPEFTQRFRAEVAADGTTVDGEWQKSYDSGVTWEHDFDVRYTRTDS